MPKKNASELPNGGESLENWGLKSPKRILQLIEDAQRKTGKTKTDLINRLIERYIKEVEAEMIREEHKRLSIEISKLDAKPSK
jgi:predicted DNA-binding protein